MKRKSRRGRRSARRHLSGMRASLRSPITMLQPAVIGAAGALAVNGVMNYVTMIPDTLKTGNTVYLTRFGIAWLIGMLGHKVPGLSKYANALAQGGMVVAMTDLGKSLALSAGMNLSGTGYAGPGSVVSRGSLPLVSRATLPALPTVSQGGADRQGAPFFGMSGTGRYMRGAGLYTR